MMNHFLIIAALLLLTSEMASSFKPNRIMAKIKQIAVISSSIVSSSLSPVVSHAGSRSQGNRQQSEIVSVEKRSQTYDIKKKGTDGDSIIGNAKTQEIKAYSPLRSAGTSFVRDAVRSVGPAVVRIDCEREIPSYMSMFSENLREGETVKISGSGIVVSSDGFLLTNAHVVEGSKKVTVTFSNGRTFKAQVIASDELTDLAVLKAAVGDENISKAPLGDSATLHSGDWVIAVGCPVGLDFTVTLGIVSSPKRSAYEVGAPHLKGSYIQTDAALNSGNSGGPLVNDMGEVIGINTMVRSNTEAIGFAIPINRALKIYETLKQGKKPTHAYFGLEVMTLTPDFSRIHNDDPNAQQLPEVHGALVLRVAPGSPAAASGIRRNDIIVEVNGFAIGNSDDADVFLDQCRPGVVTKIKVARGEKAQKVELHAMPQDLLSIIDDRRKRQQSAMVRPPPQPTPSQSRRG